MLLLYLILLASTIEAFRIRVAASGHSRYLAACQTGIRRQFHIFSTNREESVNMMTVDEIKSELELRGVNYENCINKSQLAELLLTTRSKGKADPNIIDQFNNNLSDKDLSSKFEDPDIMQQAISNDGTLPGGLSPQVVKAMTSDPEIMRLLRDPKMQDVMKSVMTAGPDGIKKYLSDPDAMLLIQRLSKAMERATNNA